MSATCKQAYLRIPVARIYVQSNPVALYKIKLYRD